MTLSFSNLELSPTAGRNGDGVVVGAVDQSLLRNYLVKAPFVTGLKSLRRDALSGNVYEDISALVSNAQGASV